VLPLFNLVFEWRLYPLLPYMTFPHSTGSACLLLLQHKAATPAYDAYNEREKLDFAHNPIEDLSVPTEQQ
jgi:hypothetical protein